ncbi:proline-rich nuclear receptor coactivator 1 [Brienomyrus brachyistius]|uniref:proline-rich nuclear receptor coactivator 1 n=1 Tax=Brienomyrus brachyistius TaxID=42636 RepID=UPI0020B2DF83|nr:proline-rich nuclear receptor coactivator 1 [Brienomyrus brachyistius]
MYLPPDLPAMLGETFSSHDGLNLDNIENKPLTSHLKRQALHKKGGRKVRPTAAGLQSRYHNLQQQQQHQRHPGLLRANPARFADINNTVGARSKSPAAGSEGVASRTQTTVLTLHQLKHGAKKEVLKSKSARPEKGLQPNVPAVHGLNKHEHAAQNRNGCGQKNRHVNTPGAATSARRSDRRQQQKSSSPLCHEEVEKARNAADNSKIISACPAEPVPEDSLRDGEKVYAGAKFSEPPSPSVLPKPPSHWVGEKAPQHCDQSREQMTVHLKTLLKVKANP